MITLPTPPTVLAIITKWDLTPPELTMFWLAYVPQTFKFFQLVACGG